VENYYRAVDEVCADLEAAFNGDREDDEIAVFFLGFGE